MAEDAADARFGTALAELLERRRIVIRRPPHPRALREDLNRVGTDGDRAVDCGVDAARRRDVCADLHELRSTLSTWVYASAWHRARPASCMSGASGRFSSTGCSPATTAASSSCGS